MFLLLEYEGDQFYQCQDCGVYLPYDEVFAVRQARLAHHRCDPDWTDPF